MITKGRRELIRVKDIFIILDCGDDFMDLYRHQICSNYTSDLYVNYNSINLFLKITICK